MALEIQINDSPHPNARYIANAPSPCRIRQAPPADGPVNVTLRSRPANAKGGQAVFYASAGHKSRPTLELTLPADGTWVPFGLGGKFESPSVDDRDCLLVVDGAGPEVTVPLMVRVRKNADKLTPRERDRFLEALAALNAQGTGKYQDFRDTHVHAARQEEHGGPHFLPWHRAFLLDLERELQAIDPSVSLPYWRFDKPAPNVFRSNFMGATTVIPENGPEASVVFDPGHPLAGWVADGQPGILRSAIFDTQTSPAPGPTGFRMFSQDETLALGSAYGAFVKMEGQPHGAAHVSFSGPISSVPTAVKDPLFFLLHCNVDRLWALWQWLNKRMDPMDTKVYLPQNQDGRRLSDTMWPWNNVRKDPRPNFAPGGPLPSSPVTPSPGPAPTVRSMIDFEGHVTPSARIAYGYDDVPFEFA